MAGSLEPAMATTIHSTFQWALMSIATMVPTVLLLLLCGFCLRLRKKRAHSLRERNGSLNRAPTTLTKVTQKKDDLPVYGTKTVNGIENGAFSASEREEQSKTPVEVNGVVVGMEETASLHRGLQTSHGSSDSRRASQNKTLQGPQESLKHRRLPSIPHTMLDQPNSEQSSGVLVRRPTVQPPAPPTYEEVHVGKATDEAQPPEGTVGGRLVMRSGPMHESWIDNDEEWPAAPPLTLFDQPPENVYTDLRNESMAAIGDQPTIDSAGTLESSSQATASAREEANDKDSTSTPPLLWRFHLSLASNTEDKTTAQDPILKDLYSKVKKNPKRPDSLLSSTVEHPIKVEDDVPPPVPIKRFNVEEDLFTQNQDIEEPLPLPPILGIN
ncbi:uncharacterized protein [Pleurodeles waltl]|uniref:uncharacterized protein n=1 Tax=Pleurodeles waltl TaxID=8319 RepID=UPI0037097B57